MRRLAVLVVLALAPAALAAQQSRPPEATDSAIARGRELYAGAANCQECHGRDGRGTKDGPDLTDATWTQADGSYAGIVKLVTHGVSKRNSTTGKEMPMRGWEPLDDAQVRAVAAYVWSLSHPDRPPR